MKHLYLIRHADSSPASLRMDDRNRHLSEMGKKDAKTMSMHLSSYLDATLDLIYSSPAKRAKSTAQIFHAQFELTQSIDLRTEIYNGDLEDILHIITTTDNINNNIAIFGHNPTFTYLINHLASANIGSLPTCGIAELTIKVDDWMKVEPNIIELKSVISPKSI